MSGRRLHAVQETPRGRNTAREERETGEEDATRYIIVGSWHSSRTRRSLIHAWNSRESRGDKAKGVFTRCRNRGGNISLFQEFSNCLRGIYYAIRWNNVFCEKATKSNIVSSKNVCIFFSYVSYICKFFACIVKIIDIA